MAITTRYDQETTDWLKETADTQGTTVSELQRRAMRLLRLAMEGDDTFEAVYLKRRGSDEFERIVML